MSEKRPIGVGFRKPPESPRPGPTTRVRMTRRRGEATMDGHDLLATEEPCEIRVQHRGIEHTIAVTMRTPGHDFELALGFLLGEGLIRGGDVSKISYCASGPPEQLYNVVTVELRDDAGFDPAGAQRAFITTSSCGVCGKASLEAVEAHGCEPITDPLTMEARVVRGLPDALRAKQTIFDKTGGLHAAGLFDASGAAFVVREDVGRHNAVDKVAGWSSMNDVRGDVLQVSGRASFEIVQKAAMARIPIVSAVSAPSSLAVATAERFGLTLIGFVRGEDFNVYSAPERITPGRESPPAR